MEKPRLSINADFKTTLEKGGEKVEAINAATIDDVLVHIGQHQHWVNGQKNSGINELLKHIPTAKAYISKVGELDNDYYYGAVDRYCVHITQDCLPLRDRIPTNPKRHFDIPIINRS